MATRKKSNMKGMTIKGGHKRPTKSGAGMTAKGVAKYRRQNPGSKLKTAVTGTVKKGSKAAKRRKSYCARSAGIKDGSGKLTKDNKESANYYSRRYLWNC